MAKKIRDIVLIVCYFIVFTLIISLPVMYMKTPEDIDIGVGQNVNATEETQFELPIELASDDETLEIYGAVQVFEDEALTKEVTGVVLDQPTTSKASIQFKHSAEDTVLYVKIPTYITGKAVTATTSTINSNTAELKLEDKFEYEMTEYTVSERAQYGVKTLIITFEAAKLQTVFPFEAELKMGGETYEATAGADFDSETFACKRMHFSIGIPEDIEVDLEGATITFDSVKEIHPSFVVPYYTNTVTK